MVVSAAFVLGLFPLALLDAFLVRADYSGGSAVACTILAGLGWLGGAGISRIPWFRDRPRRGFALGISCSLVPQAVAPFRGLVAVFLALSLVAVILKWLPRLLRELPPLRHPGALTFGAFLLLIGALAGRDRLLDRAVAGALAAPRGVAAPHQPDLILVVLDTLRADALGVDSEGSPRMPWLQSFARGCRRYSRSYSVSNFTPPGHAGLFTGLYPAESDTLGAGRIVLGAEQHTLAEFLSARGYRTLGVTSNLRIEHGLGFGQGFQVYDDGLVLPGMWTKGLLRLARSTFFGFPGGGALSPILQVKISQWTLRAQHRVAGPVTTERVLADLDEAEVPADTPLFLFVNYYDPHLPYTCSGKTRDAIEELFASTDLLRVHQEILRLERAWREDPADPDLRRKIAGIRRAYWAQLDLLDRSLQDLFAGLKKRRSLENALVVITADHGEELGEHGLFLHGGSLDEEQIRVPLLIAGPGFPPGEDPTPVSGVDLFPTICRALDVACPPGLPGSALQGPLPPVRALRFEGGARRGFLLGWRKFLAEDGTEGLRWLHAYDLEVDPREGRDRIHSGLPWVKEGLDACPFQTSGPVKDRAGGEAVLRQLGYAGETESEGNR